MRCRRLSWSASWLSSPVLAADAGSGNGRGVNLVTRGREDFWVAICSRRLRRLSRASCLGLVRRRPGSAEGVSGWSGDVRRRRWGTEGRRFGSVSAMRWAVVTSGRRVNNLKSFSELRRTNLDSRVTILELLGGTPEAASLSLDPFCAGGQRSLRMAAREGDD